MQLAWRWGHNPEGHVLHDSLRWLVMHVSHQESHGWVQDEWLLSQALPAAAVLPQHACIHAAAQLGETENETCCMAFSGLHAG